MNVVVIGSGYVGLVTGVCLADFGHTVTCIDTDQARVELLNQCIVPFFEPGLQELMESNFKAKRLSFETDLTKSVLSADVVFIAVGTPNRVSDGKIDLSFVKSAAKAIASASKDFTLVINKSTVPCGTGDIVEKLLRETNPACEFAVVSNPEFLREGSAIRDFKKPDRIVVGFEDDRALRLMRKLYEPLTSEDIPALFTDRRTAELIKYASNAFLATKISFINEIANLAEATNADVQLIAKGMGLDKRIGDKFLHAGPGYGGSCFPKDTVALVHMADELNCEMSIVRAVISSNDARKIQMSNKIEKALNGELKNKRIAVLGLTFKPNTDDMRDAPSLVILPRLKASGANIVAYDPEGQETAMAIFKDIEFAKDPYSCVTGADAIVIMTEWDQFRALDLARIKDLVSVKLIIDFRNIFQPEIVQKQGFKYLSVGR